MPISADIIVGEARDVQDRQLSAERATELAVELNILMKSSQELRRRLVFDDQASDFARALLETSGTAYARSKTAGST
jgi:hypothetical protein